MLKKTISVHHYIGPQLIRYFRSLWFFPTILVVPLLIFTILGIHGSSIGTHRQILYGDASADPSLIANNPESIRSDEWLVNTESTIAQSKVRFSKINPNLGNGEDVSVMAQVPNTDWSTIFRPQNWGYFILPLENAFAMQWWLTGYLLLVSCYLFVLCVLPGKKSLAIMLSLALLLSGYAQWWYAYGTFGPMYYSMFISTVIIYFFRQKKVFNKILLCALLAYILSCFVLVLYPPFQIACGLVLFAFLLGVFLENKSKKNTLRNLVWTGVAVFIAIAVVASFVLTRHQVVKTLENTAYPGNRISKSGGVNVYHFFSSQLGYQFLSQSNTGNYKIDGINPTNQSEASNFLIIAPFLLFPSIFILFRSWKNKNFEWSLLLICLLFLIFMLQLFATGFTPFAKFLLLSKVGAYRSLIGVGLLNVFMAVLVIRGLIRQRIAIPKPAVAGYFLLVLAVELFLSLHAHYSFGPFVSFTKAILFSLPVPLTIYFLLKQRFALAAAIYMAFTIFIGYRVNPLYRGLDTLTNDPLSVAISKTNSTPDEKWITDGGFLENMAWMNGKHSLSGVYAYPQLSLWRSIPTAKEFDYNRYAHVGFRILDDPSSRTTLKLITADSFVVETSACSSYLKSMNVGFIVTTAILSNPCVKQINKVSYPLSTIYIYGVTPSL